MIAFSSPSLADAGATAFGDTLATREIWGNVPAWLKIAFYAAVTLAFGAATLAFIRRGMQWRRGETRANSRDRQQRSLGARIAEVARYLAFHRELRRDPFAGTAHMLMFYGFFVLFIGTCLVAAEDYGRLLLRSEQVFFFGWFYLVSSLVVDLGGVAFLVGLAMFIYRRAAKTSTRVLNAWWVGAFVWLLVFIGISGFILEGARIARDLPPHEKWSVVGYSIGVGLAAVGIHGEAARSFHRALWIGHAVLCVMFFALLPWGFFKHMIVGAASWATRTRRPRAQLRMPEPAVASPGAVTWQGMPFRDLLQADACTTCGRCDSVCPAAAAGKPLRPRDVVLGLRAAMDADNAAAAGSKSASLSSFISDDVIWSCTTCQACNEACPVGIEVYDKIVETRRGRVESGVVPSSAVRVFESSSERFNPFDKPASERMTWAAGMSPRVARDEEKIELLYWVGCAGAFDSDGQGVARSMVKILNHLGIEYRILGSRERCTGDPARRMGEEGLFQELAKRNIGMLASHRVKKVLTHCPHCFNTFRNEYPQLGASFEVEHHSVFLSRMLAEGRLKLPRSEQQTITFHDPCYLGRGNGETKAPRDVLMSLPQVKLAEMPRHGKESFCCGAGGGSMWLDIKGSTRVENLRAKEAAETGAGVVATGCPFCKGMLKAGGASLGENAMPAVKDLAELIVEAEGL